MKQEAKTMTLLITNKVTLLQLLYNQFNKIYLQATKIILLWSPSTTRWILMQVVDNPINKYSSKSNKRNPTFRKDQNKMQVSNLLGILLILKNLSKSWEVLLWCNLLI